MSPPGEQRLTYPLPQDAPERGCSYDIHAPPSSSPPLQSPSCTPMSNLTPQTTPIPPREGARASQHPQLIPAPCLPPGNTTRSGPCPWFGADPTGILCVRHNPGAPAAPTTHSPLSPSEAKLLPHSGGGAGPRASG